MIRAEIRQMFQHFLHYVFVICHLYLGPIEQKDVSLSLFDIYLFYPKMEDFIWRVFRWKKQRCFIFKQVSCFSLLKKYIFWTLKRVKWSTLWKNVEKCWLWDIKVPRSTKQRFLNANKNRHLALCLLFRTYATQTLIYGIANIKKSMRRRWSWDSASSGLEVPFEHTVLNVHFLSKNSPLTKTYLHIQK